MILDEHLLIARLQRVRGLLIDRGIAHAIACQWLGSNIGIAHAAMLEGSSPEQIAEDAYSELQDRGRLN